MKAELLLKAFKNILYSRLLEKKMTAMQRHGQIGTYAGCAGQEALYTGLGLAMKPEDCYVPYYRDQPALMLRGYQPIDFMRYWGGDERGNTIGNDFPICVPIATQTLHAAGAAFALLQLKHSSIVVVTLGDGASSKGDFYEALNFASLHRLPIIFVINNNGWAISVPLEKQSATQQISQKGIGFNIPSKTLDGLCVKTVYKSMKEAIKTIKSNGGPILLEYTTYRLCDHTTADDSKRYKSLSSHDKERANDPLKTLEVQLLESGLLNQNSIDLFIKEFNEKIQSDAILFQSETNLNYNEYKKHVLEKQSIFEPEVSVL